MATVGYRTLKKLMGRGGAFLNPSKGTTTGLRAVLRAICADLNDLHAHTHRVDPEATGVQSTSVPKSDAGSAGSTGGTAISFTTFTIE